MTDQNQAESANRTAPRHAFWVTAGVFILLGPVAAFAKQGTVPLLIALLLAYPTPRAFWLQFKSVFRHPLFIAFTTLMIWSGITLLWAETPNLLSLIRLFILGTLGMVSVFLISSFSEVTKQKLSYVIAGSLTFLLFVLIFEGVSEATLHKLLRPEDVAPREGEWVPYLLMVAARGTAILAPFCFVGAAIYSQLTDRSYSGVIFVALALLTTSLLPMDASTLAILCGCIGFVLVRWRPKPMIRLLFATTLILAYVSPFLTAEVFTREQLQEQGIELSRNQTQRIAIWEYASELIFEKPVLGHGFDSSRVIGNKGLLIPGTNWPALPLHPHNAFLQIWLELGVVGVTLVALMIGLVWRYIELQIKENRDASVLIAVFVTALVISLISFGIWQYWWIATWALVAGAIQCIKPQRIEAH